MLCNRRTFFTAASGLALGARMAAATAQGANDRIRIGVIGTGGRARGLMNHLKKLPDAEIVSICDVYEPRMLQAAEIAGPTATLSMTSVARRPSVGSRTWITLAGPHSSPRSNGPPIRPAFHPGR